MHSQSPKLQQRPGTTRQPAHLTAEELSGEIGYAFEQEPALEGSVLKAMVDDESIIVTGLVPDQGARHHALKIAKQYAGKRQVVDRITVEKK